MTEPSHFRVCLAFFFQAYHFRLMGDITEEGGMLAFLLNSESIS